MPLSEFTLASVKNIFPRNPGKFISLEMFIISRADDDGTGSAGPRSIEPCYCNVHVPYRACHKAAI
jgi:hypothetical protein